MKWRLAVLAASLFSVQVLPAETQLQIHPNLLNGRWQARWIAHPTAPAKEYGIFHFRKRIKLAQRPEQFVVHVSADNRYRLFVNGDFVCDGPARGDPGHWRFETVDLASSLQAGDNVLASVVWNYGESPPVNQMSYRTGFILQADQPEFSFVNTNGSWKVMQNPSYSPVPETETIVGPFERVDAAKYPWGWEGRSFDESQWASARELEFGIPRGIGVGAHWGLVPRSIPGMELKYQRFHSIRRSEGVPAGEGFLQGRADLVIPSKTQAALLLDMSVLTTAYPELIVSGGKASELTLTYAEALVDQEGRKGNRNEIEGRHIAGNFDIFLPDGGATRMFRPLWFRTFRYLELKIRTGEAPLTIHDFHSHYTGYPFEEEASFSSDDPGLDKIWEVGWHTARLCAGETYYDCPYYEQLQYLGDTRIQALISLYVAGDDRLMRNAIGQFDDSRIPDGITQSRYPSSETQFIPPFSLYWIGMIHDFWMYRDDPDFVRSHLEGIRGILHWFEQHVDESGMLGPLPWWSFVDWPDQWPWDNVKDFGGVPSGAENGHSAILTLQFVQALQLASELAKAFQNGAEASHYQDLAERLKKSTREKCWEASQGLLADMPTKNTFSQHANVLAILTGLVPDREKELMNRLISSPDLIQCTFYFRFYMFRALKQLGLSDRYVELLQPWRDMLQLGLTTFAERPEPTRSDCHAWSASPNYDLLATVCGIEPASPGFKTVRIAPHLGPLQWVKGKMPHPRGIIEAQFQRVGQHGIEGKISLPPNLTGEMFWNGKTIPLREGSQSVSLPATP